MKQIILVLLLLSLGACVTTKPKRQAHKPSPQKPTRQVAQVSNLRAFVAFKQLPDGSYCQINVRRNNKLTPNFVQPDGGSDPLPKNDIPICSEKDKRDFQNQAENFYLKGNVIQKTSLSAAGTAGISIVATAIKSGLIGCFFGAGVSWFSSFLDFSKKQLITADVIGGGLIGFAGAIDIASKTMDNIPQTPSNAKARVGGIGGSLIAGPATGIAGAIVCEDGTTYLLSDTPKTDM